MIKKFSGIFAVLMLAFAALAIFSLPIPTANAAVPSWDFEDHGYDSTSFTNLTGSQLVSEFQMMNSVFQQHELPSPLHFAYPNGEYNATVINYVQQYRLTGRTAGGGLVFPETYPVSEWYSMTSANLHENVTFAQAKAWIDSAVATKGLVNLFTHKVSDPPITYGTTPAVLTQVLDYLVTQQNAGNLSVLTMRQAYSSFDGQKAVIVMSFDDGWATDYSVVWPLFTARGLAGTSYIIGSTVGSSVDTLTWAMISEMCPPAPYSRPVAVAWAVSAFSSPSAGGTTTLPFDRWVCPQGALSVTAIPAPGYNFSYWLFDGVNMTTNPVFLPGQTYATYHNLTAVFTAQAWSLSVNSSVGGTTAPSGAMNVTGPISINATAAANYTFSYWQFNNLNVTSASALASYNVVSTNTTSTITIPQQIGASNNTLTASFTKTTATSP